MMDYFAENVLLIGETITRKAVMTMKTSVRKADVLMAIAEFHHRNGYAPTIREIGKLVGLSSPCTVHQYLNALRIEKKVEYRRDCPRTLRVKGAYSVCAGDQSRASEAA